MVTFSPVQVSPLTNEDRSGEGALYPWVRLGPERNAVPAGRPATTSARMHFMICDVSAVSAVSATNNFVDYYNICRKIQKNEKNQFSDLDIEPSTNTRSPYLY